MSSIAQDPHYAPDANPTPGKMPIKAIAAATVGHAVEWFDWTIYSLFAVYFATQIFDDSNPQAALLMTFATFGAAFFFRPLGGWIMGRMADMAGRRGAMMLCVALMSGGSFVIGALPTYDQIGILAPIILILARIAQGIAAGGELSNTSAYLSEIAPPGKRGRYVSFMYIGTGVALLLATTLGFFLTRELGAEKMAEFGWRIPFILGGIFALVGLFMRKDLKESDVFEEHVATATEKVRNPLMTTLRLYPMSVLHVLGTTMLFALVYYALIGAVNSAVKTKFSAEHPEVGQNLFLAMIIAIVVFIALQYPLGALSDKIGRKPMMLTFTIFFTVGMVPLSKLATWELTDLIILYTVGLGFFAFASSILPAIMAELFPTEIRSTGIGAWYNITVAIFGGGAPYLITWLGGRGQAPMFYWIVSGVALVSTLIILSMPETKGKRLDSQPERLEELTHA
ncbi:MFS transporter [Kribbia dieselivorans]|uniref:MFS transporter n=1 Tax=Kribbia dieselivorans TaxID=331526 RepID=UPI000AC75457|nr:MFS transporter [Kribbia dieselivorans]